MSRFSNSDRKYVWGNATVKKPLNTVSTQTGSESRLSKSANSRLEARPAVEETVGRMSRSIQRDDINLTSIEGNFELENLSEIDRLKSKTLERINSDQSRVSDSEPEVTACVLNLTNSRDIKLEIIH